VEHSDKIRPFIIIRPTNSSRKYGKSEKADGKYFLFSAAEVTHTHTHTHTHQLYVQNVTPATENFVVHATIIVENRTQNYCAQAVLKCVQNAGLSDKKLH